MRGAQINDDLANVLNSARWNGDLATQAKFVKDGVETRIPAVQATFDETAKVLNWTGDLEPYQVVTITYSVTVTSVRGAVLKNVVTAPVLPGVPRPECEANCETENEVPQGKYVYSKTSDQPRAVKSGDKITYTLNVRHTEGDTVVGASIMDDLTSQGLLENASYNNDATLVSGPGALDPVDSDKPVIVWKGDLAQDEAAVVTFSVTVNAKPIPGTEVALVNTLTSEDPQLDRHGCVDGVADNCRTEHVVEPGSYVYSKTSDPVSSSEVKPGQKITYTVRVKHAGGDRVLGASVIDNLAGVFPHAIYNADVAASAGTVVVDEAGQRLMWTGDLAIGQETTITYSVTVKEGNADTLANYGDCSSGGGPRSV